eukprot:CAMPEP_0114255234 /NCGR_PEP_ID=MMETSP0058-20121206/17439_1 /TAXON_ID=36894 /ORGANISM="Pyramimonas parkeae, CCMP726" /LENGTH=95 /DNA_ID=CAMNT_0001369577 /DNA_START=577 /DNA_END=864 /DNA_ORIENTATION=-
MGNVLRRTIPQHQGHSRHTRGREVRAIQRDGRVVSLPPGGGRLPGAGAWARGVHVTIPVASTHHPQWDLRPAQRGYQLLLTAEGLDVQLLWDAGV